MFDYYMYFYPKSLEMKYDITNVRRQDRLLEEGRARKLLTNGEYGFLALAGAGNDGYGVPLSYVFDGDDIWFHCAPDGEKLRRIEYSDKATFCVVGRTEVLPDKFSTLYESVIASGCIEVVEDEDSKLKALSLLVAKYSPDYIDTGAKYARISLARTVVLRFKIDSFSGKGKQSASLPQG